MPFLVISPSFLTSLLEDRYSEYPVGPGSTGTFLPCEIWIGFPVSTLLHHGYLQVQILRPALAFAIELPLHLRQQMEVGQKLFTDRKPSQLVYLELGLGNGGMLLSLSEDGFRFRAVAPVRLDFQMPFAFSLD